MKSALFVFISLFIFSDSFAEQCKGLTQANGRLPTNCAHKFIPITEAASSFANRKSVCQKLANEKGQKAGEEWAKDNCNGGSSSAQIVVYTGSESDPSTGKCDFYGSGDFTLESSVVCLNGVKLNEESIEECKNAHEKLELDAFIRDGKNEEVSFRYDGFSLNPITVTPSQCRNRLTKLFDKLEETKNSLDYNYEIFELEQELGLTTANYEKSAAKTIDELLTKIDKLTKVLLKLIGESSKLEKIRNTDRIQREEKLARLEKLKENAKKDKVLYNQLKSQILTPECTVTIGNVTSIFGYSGLNCVCKGKDCQLVEVGFTTANFRGSNAIGAPRVLRQSPDEGTD